jgi:hypothetical protein
MTVKELIDQLSTMPPETEVRVEDINEGTNKAIDELAWYPYKSVVLLQTEY